jgi:hypothetical protein
LSDFLQVLELRQLRGGGYPISAVSCTAQTDLQTTDSDHSPYAYIYTHTQLLPLKTTRLSVLVHKHLSPYMSRVMSLPLLHKLKFRQKHIFREKSPIGKGYMAILSLPLSSVRQDPPPPACSDHAARRMSGGWRGGGDQHIVESSKNLQRETLKGMSIIIS